MLKKYKPSDILTIGGVLAVIYGFSAATLFTPDNDFSEDENRYLQLKPKFSLEALVDGSFTSEIADYYSDQIPLRNIFVGTKAISEIALFKQENDDVLLGSDGHIIAKNDYPNLSEADKNVKAINRFLSAMETSSDSAFVGIDFKVAIAGRSQDVLEKYMPSLYPASERTEQIFDYVYDRLEAPHIELLEPLKSRADSGEYVYYRTDHHWTTLGAYYAYVEIMKSYGIEPYPIDYFTRETASEEFYGTTWSKAGMKWIAPDTIEFFRWDGDDDMVTEIVDNGKTLDGMYDRSYLDVKDKYSSFIGGNNGYVKIYPADGSPLRSVEREKLILIKDSFGHSLAPFLAAHFDLEILDLRYYKLPVIDFVRESGADRVLILYNMDGLVSSNSLAMLNYGIKN
ncbi:MAG: hypothetical protein HFE63_05120 [Clostridiales bacterium]|nr:hypothetical protein [Clostridiales bacterium]